MKLLYKHSGANFEHIAIAEKALGRLLKDPEQVHHVNCDSLDNRNGNLVICPDYAYHALLHIRTRALEASGNPNFRPCVRCRKHDSLENLRVHSRNRTELQYVHLSCRRAVFSAWYFSKRDKNA